jgi:hypothetical protein
MAGLRKLVAATAACAVALSATAGAVGTSPAAADWELQAQFKGEGYLPHVPILGISCPSTKFCVAVGELDEVITSTNPTGGQSAWRDVRPTGEAETDCHEHWVPPCRDPKKRTIRRVACPSAKLCVAVTGEGYIYSSTNPTGSADDWRVADIDDDGRDTHLLGLSCPTASLCVAVSGERYTSGKVLTSTNPNGGAGAWTVTQLDESLDLRGVSCGTPDLCVAVAQQGRMLVSTNPTGGVSAWKEIGAPGGPGDLHGVSCATTVLCVAGNVAGNLLASTNPTAASSWEETNGGISVEVTDVSCLPTRQCVAVTNNGDVLATPNPMVGRGAWSLTRLIPYEQPANEFDLPLNGLFGVSCVSISFCALVASDGRIYTNTDPFAEPSGPSKESNTGKKKKRGHKRPRVKVADLILPSPGSLREHRGRVIIRFFATGPVRRFECKVNRAEYRTCRSPKYFHVAKKGTYAFRIRAVGKTGLRGPATVKRVFTGKRCVKKNARCYSPAGELPLK